MSVRLLTAISAVVALGATAAQADLTISGKPTRNVTCTGGVCTAKAKRANLNAADLATMLATGDVTAATQDNPQDLVIASTFQWAGTHHFAMKSSSNIRVNAPIVATGTSGVTINSGSSGTDGTVTYGTKGQLEFWDTASTLAINGISYKLVGDLATLTADIDANPSGAYALAKDYDAKVDGTYKSAPVGVVFRGSFEGLGNTISRLTIRGKHPGASLALFSDEGGIVTDLHLTKVSITGKELSTIGGIAADMHGLIMGSSVSGHLSGGANSSVGGLAGEMPSGQILFSSFSGSISGADSDTTSASTAGGIIGKTLSPSVFIGAVSSSASVSGGAGWRVGGLIGGNVAIVTECYATGTVSVGDNGFSGGLIGENFGNVTNSYATGFTGGSTGTTVGGFIGHNAGPVEVSYSSGGVASGSGNAVGGFIGNDSGPSDLTSTYFDIDTSGQSHGVGNNTGYPGVTALTTEQFQAGLPAGFDPAIWAESVNINGGLPYLSVFSAK